MLKVIDISAYQRGLELSYLVGQIDAVIVKATEGTSYVNDCCDDWIQKAKKYQLKRGVYHFLSDGRGVDEAKYFIDNCSNYFFNANHDINSSCIPILDWEPYDVSGNISRYMYSGEVNKAIHYIHDATGIWPWVYANPWRFENADEPIEPNCMRWVAAYPGTLDTFEAAADANAPECDTFAGAWQFTASLKLSGYAEGLDGSIYYGDAASWDRYCIGDNTQSTAPGPKPASVSVLENDLYRVTIEAKR